MIDALVDATGSPRPLLEQVLAGLEGKGLLVAVDRTGPAYIPGAPLDRITAEDILNAVRGDTRTAVPDSSVDALVDEVMRGFESSLEKRLRQQTLDDLVARSDLPHSALRASG